MAVSNPKVPNLPQRHNLTADVVQAVVEFRKALRADLEIREQVAQLRKNGRKPDPLVERRSYETAQTRRETMSALVEVLS
jgi:hypothetical protein